MRRRRHRIRYRTVRRTRRRYRYYVIRTCRHCRGEEVVGDFPTRALAKRFLKVVPLRRGFTVEISTTPDY